MLADSHQVQPWPETSSNKPVRQLRGGVSVPVLCWHWQWHSDSAAELGHRKARRRIWNLAPRKSAGFLRAESSPVPQLQF